MSSIDLLDSLDQPSRFKSILDSSTDSNIYMEAFHILVSYPESKVALNRTIIDKIVTEVKIEVIIDTFLKTKSYNPFLANIINRNDLNVSKTVLNQFFMHAVQFNHIKIVESFLDNNRVDPGANNNAAIREASLHGHIEVVKLLLDDERVDPGANNNMAIQNAILEGHTEVAKLLLDDKRVDPSDNNSEAIQWASLDGNIEVVKLLLENERVDPSANNNRAIQWASRNGHLKVVELLLADSRVNPSAGHNKAIRSASSKGQFEVVQALLKDPRVNPSARNNEAIKYGHGKIVRLLSIDERVISKLKEKDRNTIVESWLK